MSNTSFSVVSKWLADGLTPAEIGDRALHMLQQLGRLGPAMSNWLLIDRAGQGVPLAEATPEMTTFVEQNVMLSDYASGEPDPELGYDILVVGSEVPSQSLTPRSIHISVSAGSKWRNDAEFQVGSRTLDPPDLSLVTYPIYKGALETLASAWPCPWVLAYCFTHSDDEVLEWDGVSPIEDLIAQDTAPFRRPFGVAWIAYLSPPLAQGLTPPREIVWERTPGGGMILSAVQERLDAANPEHVRRASLLEAIMNERVGVRGRDPAQAAILPARTAPY